MHVQTPHLYEGVMHEAAKPHAVCERGPSGGGGDRLATFSNHGTGVMMHGAERRPGGRVEFTTWVCVFWVPLLRSWSGVYAGEGLGDGVNDESHRFANLRRVPHDWGRIYLTFTRGLLAAACAAAPAYVMAHRTHGRGATGRKWSSSSRRRSGPWP